MESITDPGGGSMSVERRSVSLIEGMREGYLREPYKMMIAGSYESMTYADAYYRTLALAQVLSTRWGIDSHSTVIFSAFNLCWYPVVLAAIQMCGARAVLVTAGSEAKDYEHIIPLVRPRLAIISSLEHDEILEEMTPELPRASLGYTFKRTPRLEDLVIRAMNEGAFMNGPQAEDSEIVLFSSGSTGAPKAIVNRSSSFQRSARALISAFGCTSRDVCYVPVPFSHTYGVVGMYTAIEAGCTFCTNVKYRPDVSIATIASLQATIYLGVPTMYVRELAANADDYWDISSLRAGLVAGSTCPESVVADYERRYGCRLIQSYGMTETAATLTVGSLDDPLAMRAHTVGLPIEGAEIRLLPETHEIACKTPSLMSGVLRDDGSFDPCLDEDGWFHSGDVGALDDDGRLSITGRIKDIIIRGGINIFPAEVENAYQDNEDVAMSCLVGYPDPELGERTALCVVLADGADTSAHELRSYAKGKLEKCKIPDVVLKMDDLPRLANGKIDKKALRTIVPGLLEQPIAYRAQKGRQ